MPVAHIGFRRYAIKVDTFIRRWWLVTSVSLMFACILFGRLSGKIYYSDYARNVEDAIAAIEHEFDTIAGVWLDTAATKDASFVWRDSSLVHNMRAHNTGIFLFDHDSLVYWSKSPMDEPQELLQTDTSRRFVYLGNKILLPLRRDSCGRKAISLINLAYYNTEKTVISDATWNHIVDTRSYAILPYSDKGLNIRSRDGELLFGIEPRKIDRNMSAMEYIGLLGFFIFCYGITLWGISFSRHHNAVVAIIGTALLILLLRIMAIYTGFPSEGSFWFSPHSGINELLSTKSYRYFTVGNLFIDTFLMLLIASMAERIKHRIKIQSRKFPTATKRTYLALWLVVSSAFMVWQIYLISRLIYAKFDSKNIVDIFSFDLETFVSYIIVVAQTTIYILFFSSARTVCSRSTMILSSCIRPLAVIVMLALLSSHFFGMAKVGIICVAALAVLLLAALWRDKQVHWVWHSLIMAAMITAMIFHDSRNHLNALQQHAAIELATKNGYSNSTLYSYLLSGDTRALNNTSAYSFVKVSGDHITEYNGEHIYGISLLDQDSRTGLFYNRGNYKHFIYKSPEDGSVSVVSRQEVTLIDRVTLFMYIFILLFAGQLLFLRFSIHVPPSAYFKAGIYSRVQMTVMGVIVITVGIILFAVSRFFVENQKLDLSTHIFNTAFYVTSDYRHNFRSAPTPADSTRLWQWAARGEKKYLSNINVFDRNGDLTASSSLPAYRNKIVPRKINPDIFNLGDKFKTKVVHERAGDLGYLSLYSLVRHEDGTRSYINIIFRDADNKPTSLPLIINILNVFVLALTVGLLVSLFLYKQIMRPLNIISQSIRDIRYRRRITGYYHKHGSELELLIDQYNNTLSDLEASYEELANREREGAWKILAQQIAHEIKNPLTPIKLKVQMLQRRKAKGDPGWADDIDGSLSSIVSQIDVLSGIVSEFSNFAKMNMKPLERIDLSALMDDILQLYLSYPDVAVTYCNNVSPEVPWVMLDAGNFRSVIVNIMVNAIYAVGERSDAAVDVALDKVDGGYRISVSDNGVGIKDEDKEMIFKPSFTTKKSGSGIGLTISRQIVKNMNGDISFTSVYGEGTTFTVFLPKAPSEGR